MRVDGDGASLMIKGMDSKTDKVQVQGPPNHIHVALGMLLYLPEPYLYNTQNYQMSDCEDYMS